MSILGDMPCPSCREAGGDKTGNHLILFEDGGATCNRCGYTTTNKADTDALLLSKANDEDDTNVMTTPVLDIQTFRAFPILGLPARGIKQETCEAYEVRSTVSPTDGHSVQNIIFPEYKEDLSQPIATKSRTPDKRFFWDGDSKGVSFFGIKAASDALQTLPRGGRTLYVTEGEIDALTLYQCLLERAPNGNKARPAVVSLPNGSAHAAHAMSQNSSFINNFDKVVLCFDSDEAGKKAREAAAQILGAKAHIVEKMPRKDANDMYMADMGDELKSLTVNAVRYMPAALVTVDDVMEDILAKPTYGLSYPWPTLTDLTFGIKTGQLIGIGAGVGVGKTDWFSQLTAHLISEHGQSVGMFKLEERSAKSFRAIASKIAHIPFHRPDVSWEEADLTDALAKIQGKCYSYDHFGFKDWASIKADIRVLKGYGVNYFIVDPLTALIAHERDEYKALNEMLEEMAALTQELDITIFYSSHLNPPPRDSKSHEEGGKVKESQFTGSRAMIRWSHRIFGIRRNKHAVDETGQPDDEARNTSYLDILKDREYGKTGTVEIHYDPNTTDYLEKEIPKASEETF